MMMFRTAILTVLALMFFTATWVFAALIYTLFVLLDCLILSLMSQEGVTADNMFPRHANLE